MEAGTSASTPIIAAMLSLLNNDRLAAGKKTLGFFTPSIYKMYEMNRNLYFRSNFTSIDNNGGCPGNGFFSNPKGGMLSSHR
jgi:tripeptidyl-peptidase I